MDQLYVIVTNSSSVVVGKNVYCGNASLGLSQDSARYSSLTFTTVDQSTFNSTTFVGPNYMFS